MAFLPEQQVREVTYQADWPTSVPCIKCGCEAGLALSHKESPARSSRNRSGPLRDHDCIAYALYLCPDIRCSTMTARWNEA